MHAPAEALKFSSRSGRSPRLWVEAPGSDGAGVDVCGAEGVFVCCRRCARSRSVKRRSSPWP